MSKSRNWGPGKTNDNPFVGGNQSTGNLKQLIARQLRYSVEGVANSMIDRRQLTLDSRHGGYGYFSANRHDSLPFKLNPVLSQ